MHASAARDPGVRGGEPGAGGPLEGLTSAELKYFEAGKEDFDEIEDVEDGLGPTLNLDGCGSCHSQPAVGGSSPAVNPQVAFATRTGNTIPSFILADGPVREARFIRNSDGTPDGGVHALFTIRGLAGCSVAQPDFESHVASRNVVFRIPTPVFGAGLIEQIPDYSIAENVAADAPAKRAFGIGGRPNFSVAGRTVTGQMNRNGNDGTIARLGWKGQNKSLLLFSGEAYNVEMGITNELFQSEREEATNCQMAATPNSVTNMNETDPIKAQKRCRTGRGGKVGVTHIPRRVRRIGVTPRGCRCRRTRPRCAAPCQPNPPRVGAPDLRPPDRMWGVRDGRLAKTSQ